MGSPAAAGRDPAEFLDVDMDQLTGPGHDNAPDRFSGHTVEVIEPVEAMTHQDAVHRGGWHVDDAGDPSWAKSSTATQHHDAALTAGVGPRR